MSKITLTNSGKKIAYLSQEANRVWMTEEQILDAGVKVDCTTIDTNIGMLIVIPSIDIMGEAISYSSLKFLLGKARDGYFSCSNAIDDFYKCMIARTICLIDCIDKKSEMSIIGDVASELGCTESEAIYYLYSDSTISTSGGSIDIMGKKISYGLLGHMFNWAITFMDRELNSLQNKATAAQKVELDARIARCRYLETRISWVLSDNAIRETTRHLSIGVREYRNLLSYDRGRNG